MELTKLRDHFKSDGFDCEENLDLGLSSASLYASRKTSLFFYPYFVHCYFFNCTSTSTVTLQQIIGYHALACAHTDRFKNKRSRFFRLRIPITVSVLISEHGFDELAIVEVSRNKQRNQMGNVNTLMLIDLSRMQFHKIRKVGFVGNLPLRYANKLIENIATTLNVVTDNT